MFKGYGTKKVLEVTLCLDYINIRSIIMMINKTTEFINYRHPFYTGLERTPKFIRRESESVKGSDIIEISEEARQLLLKNSGSALVKAGLRISPEIGALIMASERDVDADRSIRINVLSSLIERGAYNFDSFEKVRGAGGNVLSQLIRRK
jgi:hypothetical protein